MAAQLPDEEKIKAADYVIDNSGSLEDTRAPGRRGLLQVEKGSGILVVCAGPAIRLERHLYEIESKATPRASAPARTCAGFRI